MVQLGKIICFPLLVVIAMEIIIVEYIVWLKTAFFNNGYLFCVQYLTLSRWYTSARVIVS